MKGEHFEYLSRKTERNTSIFAIGSNFTFRSTSTGVNGAYMDRSTGDLTGHCWGIFSE